MDRFQEKEAIIYRDERIVVPLGKGITENIMKDGHDSMFVIHPWDTKMYQHLKKCYWWSGMKMDVAKYVYSCDICQKENAEH